MKLNCLFQWFKFSIYIINDCRFWVTNNASAKRQLYATQCYFLIAKPPKRQHLVKTTDYPCNNTNFNSKVESNDNPKTTNFHEMALYQREVLQQVIVI